MAPYLHLIYWSAFAGVAVYLLYLIQVEVERRRRIRLMRERRLRRRHMDSLEPQRWQP